MAQQGPFAAGLAQVPGVAHFVVPAGAIHVSAPVTGDGTVDTPLGVSLGNGLTLSAGALVASLGQGLGFVGGAITPALGAGLSFDGGNNLQNNLLVGLAGGQTVKGGANAGDSLTLNSTANASKGATFINDGSPTQVGVGIAAMSAWSGASGAIVEGPTQSILMGNSTDVYFLSNAYFASPNWTRKTASLAARLQMFHGTFELDVAATGAAGSAITWLPALQIDALQNVQLGKATLATTATDGFPYLPVAAGAPTGVPTAKAGFAPFQFDTANNKLWIYNGAWKGVVLA